MALSSQKKAQLALMTLPSDGEMVDRAHVFMRRSGMTRIELAGEIGYSYSSICAYLTGRYDEHHAKESNTLALRAALKQYMDLHDVQNDPVSRGKHYATPATDEVARAAVSALQRGTAYVIDGPPGTEKTWSLLQAKRYIGDNQLGRAIYVYARVGHRPHNFLQEICRAAGIPDRGNIDQLLRKLRFFLATGRTLLMVDEAQHLDHAGLEVLRQLLDLPPHFGVMLAGSHDLTQRLSHWQMEQWRSRLRKTIVLRGLSQADCRKILRAEFGAMSEDACDATIRSCISRAARAEVVNGKVVDTPFEYVSARSFFFAIEHARESLEAQQQKGAA